MAKGNKGKADYGITPGEMEIIKFRQQNPVFYMRHIEGLADTPTQTNIDYKSMGYGKAAKPYNPTKEGGRQGWGNWTAPDNIAQKAFEQQSFGEMVADTVIGFGKRMGAGFIDSIGAWDATNMTAMAMGKVDQDYSNWFNRVGKKITNNANEENQIYQDPNGSMWNMPYLANQVQQLGYTGGIIAEMVAENLLLDAVTGGSALAGSIASKSRLLGNVVKDGLFGMAQGVKEAHMNAFETQNNTYERAIQLGFSPQEAMEKSRKAANLHFKTEAGALATINGLQNAAFLGTLNRAIRNGAQKSAWSTASAFKSGFSDAFQDVGEKAVGGLTKNKAIQKTAGWGLIAGSESIEEGIQTGIGAYAEADAFGEKFSMDDLTTHEMRDSMVGGALGGLLLGAGFKAVGSYRNRNFNKAYNEFVQGIDSSIMQYQEKTNTAKKNLDDAQAKFDLVKEKYGPSRGDKIEKEHEALTKANTEFRRAQELEHLAQASEALRFDYNKRSGSTVAFDMYTEHLETVNEAIVNKDTESLIQLGLIDQQSGKEKTKGTLKYLADNHTQHMKDLEELRNMYDETLSNVTSDFGSASLIVNSKFNIYKNEEDITSLNTEIEDTYKNSKAFNRLSDRGQKIIRLRDELAGLKAGVEFEENIGATTNATFRIKEVEEQLEELGDRLSSEDTKIVRLANLDKIDGITRNMSVSLHHLRKAQLEASTENLLNEIDKNSNPEVIAKAIAERHKQDIKEAKTVEEVKEVINKIEKEKGKVEDEVLKGAVKKVEDIVVEKNLTEEEKEVRNNLELNGKQNLPTINKPTGVVKTEEVTQIVNTLSDDVDGFDMAPYNTQDPALGETDDLGDILGGLGDSSNIFKSKYSTNEPLKNQISQMVKNLDSYYQRTEGRDATLRDFVHEMINHVGLKGLKPKFNNLVEAFHDATGRDIKGAHTLYNELYNIPFDIMDSLDFDVVIETNETVEKAAEQTGKLTTDPVTLQPTIVKLDNLGRTNDARTKAAHSYQEKSRDTDGNYIVTAEELKPSPLIGNLFILDPAYTKELYESGRELEVRVRDEDDVLISIPTEDGGATQTTWGKIKGGMEPQSEAWWNNVPMVVYDGETPLFTVHSPTWYNPNNITEDKVVEGYNNILNLRKNVSTGQTAVKVTDYRFGSIDRLSKHVDSKPKSIQEAAGDASTIVVITTTKDNIKKLSISKNEDFYQRYPDAIIVGTTELTTLDLGKHLDLRFVGYDKTTGRPLFFAGLVSNVTPFATNAAFVGDLNDQAYNNVKYASLAHILLQNKDNETFVKGIETEFNFTLQNALELKGRIQQENKINIEFDPQLYVQAFLRNTELSKRTRTDATYFEYMDFQHNGKTHKGLSFFHNNEKTSKIGKEEGTGWEKSKINKLVKFFKGSETQPPLLRKAFTAVNLETLNDKEFKVLDINSDGVIRETTPYTNYMKSHLFTDFMSHEIESKNGEKKVITDVQPMIYFDSVTKEGKVTPPLTAEAKAAAEFRDDFLTGEDIEAFFSTSSAQGPVAVMLPKVENSTVEDPTLLTKDLYEELKDLGLTQEDVQALLAIKALHLGTNSETDIYNSKWIPTEEQAESFDRLSTNQISSLSYEEQKELVGSLKNIIVDSLDFSNKISLSEIAVASKDIVEKTLIPLIKASEDRAAKIAKAPHLDFLLKSEVEYADKLKTVIVEKEKLVRFERNAEDFGNILEVGSLIQEFDRLFGTKVEDIDEINDNETSSDTDKADSQEENYAKTALEKDVKLSFTNELRLKLLGIKKEKTGSRLVQLNSLALPNYYSAEEVLDRIREVTTKTPSDWSKILDTFDLKYAETGRTIYLQIKEQFESMESHIQAQVLHKLVQEPVTMYKVLISDKDVTLAGKNGKDGKKVKGEISVTMLDENSSRESFTLKQNIKEDFVYNQTGEVYFVQSDKDANKILNLEYAKAQHEMLNSLLATNANINFVTKEDIRKLFNSLGLARISDNTLDKYLERRNPFAPQGGIVFFINEQLKDIISRQEVAAAKELNLDMSLQENSLFEKASSALNLLINMEVSLNGSEIPKPVRVNGKTFQAASNSTMIQDILNSLVRKDNQELIDTLSNSPLSKDNFILKFLKEDATFQEKTNMGWTSDEFIKKHKRDSFSDTAIDTLSAGDYFAALMNAFFYDKGKTPLQTSKTHARGLDFRMAQMSTTTFSDKGRMLLWDTAVVKPRAGQIMFDAEGKVTLDETLKDFLFEQLFVPEFNRIVETYKKEKTGGKFDIIGYHEASKYFLGLPMFNSITTEMIEESGKKVEFGIKEAIVDKGAIDIERYKPQAHNMIENFISDLVNSKISSTGNTGSLVELGIYKPEVQSTTTKVSVHNKEIDVTVSETHLNNLDTKVIGKRPGDNTLEKLRFAVAEFEINTLLNQNNIYSLFLGDQAFYSKDKFVNAAIAEDNMEALAEAVSLIIDKRAAMLIAPGAKYSNSEVFDNNYLQNIDTRYHQIFMNDVEDMSSYITKYLESQYGELTQAQKDNLESARKLATQIEEVYDQMENVTSVDQVREFQKQIKDLTKKREDVIKSLKKSAPEIADYFNITGTDAQEYSTWQSHLDALTRKGDLTEKETELVKDAYQKLNAGKFEEVTEEQLKIVMQPLKTVYTGIINYTDPDTGVVLARPIYIKSSTIPLLPHVTKNTKLDIVRQKLERLEKDKGTLVKMSYQSANKIGATKTSLTMQDLYSVPYEMLYQENIDVDGNKSETGLLQDSLVTLPTSGLRIQQENPYKLGKYFKKGEDPYISMGSQFMKVIMGNGVNEMGAVFESEYFSRELLAELDIKKGKITGKNLETIYNHVYKEYSNSQRDILYEEFNIDPKRRFKDLSIEEQQLVLESLVKVLKDEITGKGYPDYMEDTLRVVEHDIFRNKEFISLNMPLIFDANSNKFESLLQALVSARLIAHKLPGNGHISASSEGFSAKKSLDQLTEEERVGIIWNTTGGIPKDLKPTYLTDDKGKKILVKSQVLIPAHYAYTDAKGKRHFVDFTSDKYSEPIKDEEGRIVGRRLRTEMMDKELLDMFAFRIPTSSHQSGVIIEVAGFIPNTMGDTIIVPREHTTQLGEDYDIDKRYIYKSNYYLDKEGVIKKIPYKTRKGEPKLNEVKRRLKGIENALIDVYKTVYASKELEVQKKVYKPLVTDIAEDTANLIQKKIKESNTNSSAPFSNLTSDYQFYLMKLGADGKGGIGQHSNGVTMQAQFDRAPKDAKVVLINKEGGARVIRFGKGEHEIVSNGILGDSTKAIKSEFDVADQHGENQNVSTDNINKQIMIKRNENSFTMSVYSILAFRKVYTSSQEVDTGLFKNGERIMAKNLSIPSLFISQPIIRRYADLKAQYSSATGDFISPTELDTIIISTLAKEFNFEYHLNDNNQLDVTKFIHPEDLDQGLNELSAQGMFDSLSATQAMKKPLQQAAALQQFYVLLKEAETLQKYNSLINLSTSHLGLSNFNNIQRVNILNEIGRGETDGIVNIDSLIGEHKPFMEMTYESDVQEGYTKVGDFMWRPTTIEGTMLINSLAAAGNIVETLFPYSEGFVKDAVVDIFANKDKDPNKKSQSGLEWKYEIVSAMRDFFYTHSATNLTNDPTEDRRRLFIDSTDNKSLASILLALKMQNHPIYENALIKDLVPKPRFDGMHSKIEHFAASVESFDKSIKYEAFKDLLVDNTTVLGEFNGEIYTPRTLAFELATYTFLSDTMGGASNFRNYIHYAYLETRGVTRGLRKISYSLQESDYKAMLEVFKKQYFQHNPDRAFILSGKTVKMSDFLYLDSTASKIDNLEEMLQKVTSFSLVQKKNKKNPPYISIRDTSPEVSNKNKKFKLFVLDASGVLYTEVPVLGDTGINEYDATKRFGETAESILLKRKIDQAKAKAANSFISTVQNSEVKGELVTNPGFKVFHNPVTAVEAILNAPSTKESMPYLHNFLTQAKEFLSKDVKIIFGDTGGALGQYIESTNTIIIKPTAYEEAGAIAKKLGETDLVVAQNRIFREMFIEEIVHASTVQEFNKYVENKDPKTKTVTLKENAPEHVIRILAMYDIAKSEVPYNPADLNTYHSKDVYEFMAGMFTSKEYAEKLEEKQPGIKQKFIDTIVKMFRNLYNQLTGTTLSYKDQMFKDLAQLMSDNTQRGILIVDSQFTQTALEQSGLRDIVNNYLKKSKQASLTPENLVSLLDEKGFIKKEC